GRVGCRVRNTRAPRLRPSRSSNGRVSRPPQRCSRIASRRQLTPFGAPRNFPDTPCPRFRAVTGGSMRRIAVLVLASLIAVSGATASPRSDGLVSKAVQALGGESALASVKTVAVKGSIRQWEPEQSVNPGGEMRLAHDSALRL